jgi:hypothetical protein
MCRLKQATRHAGGMTPCAIRILRQASRDANKVNLIGRADMTSTIKWRQGVLRWSSPLVAILALAASAPAYAVDKNLAACIAEMGAITAADEAANAVADAAAQAADVGLPVMDVGIILSFNQVNANLADLLGPITMIARSTCEMNDTVSSSASTTVFLGWTDAEDTEPNPISIPAQIDGMAGLSSPLARTVDSENDLSVKKMELNLKDGYAAALVDNELKGLANMEGIGLSGIASEKQGLLTISRNLQKLKSAGNITDVLAMIGILLSKIDGDMMRSNIIAHQHEIGDNQRERFNINDRQMSHDDHLVAAKRLAAGL